MDEKTSDSESTPRTIGNYRIERLLGRGGMGEVYLAFDERIGREVAIKKVRSDKASNDQDRVRLRREARVVARLDHPAIAQVHDVVETPDGDCVVMQYIEGRPLSDLLLQGGLDGAQASNIALGVVEGLAAAHRAGLVHRDLKAENIVVTPLGEAKILDFGLVKETTDLGAMDVETAKGLVLGTVSTMSPEQALGQKVDARSDLFSLGILLYELFTGSSPFWRERWVESLQAIRKTDPPSPRALRPELPPELSSLIERLLRKDPAERPQTAAEVAEALMRISSRGDVLRLPRPGETPVDGERFSSTELNINRLMPPAPSEDNDETVGRIPVLKRLPPWKSAVVLVSLLLAVTAILLVWAPVSEHDWVLVLAPVTENNPNDDRLPDAVLAGLLTALANFDRLHPLEPQDATQSSASVQRSSPSVQRGSPSAQRLAAGADEVLSSLIHCREERCFVVLERLAPSPDGAALQSIRRTEIPLPSSQDLEVAFALDELIPTIYPDFQRRRPFPALRPDAYQIYVDLRSRVARGLDPRPEDMLSARDLQESSPSFVEGHLLTARIAITQGTLQEAITSARLADENDSEDPRCLALLFELSLGSGDLDTAAEILQRYATIARSDPELWRLRAQLEAERGELAQAVRLGRRLAKRRPTPKLLRQLADHEIQLGDLDGARTNIERLLNLIPGDPEGYRLLEELSAKTR